MTILVGAAPPTSEEAERLIGVNAQAYRLATTGDVDGLRALLSGLREQILADPLAAFREIMDKAPEADRVVMQDPLWQASFEVSAREALRAGVDGWLDESLVMFGPWSDVEVDRVTASVTWWHAAGDANTALSAARRLVGRLPNARLVLFGEHEGHFAPYTREAEILDELLARG
jgi:hypothetical protein